MAFVAQSFTVSQTIHFSSCCLTSFRIEIPVRFSKPAVNRLALADDTVFVGKNCVPAFRVRHIRQEQIVTLAIRIHIEPQIPSWQDFWRVVELRSGKNVSSDSVRRTENHHPVARKKLITMSRKKRIKNFSITRQKCLPCRIRAILGVVSRFSCANCSQKTDGELAAVSCSRVGGSILCELWGLNHQQYEQ